jgi:hypothetical protein
MHNEQTDKQTDKQTDILLYIYRLHHNLLQNMVHRKLIKCYQDDRLWQGDEILYTVKVVTAKERFLGFIEFTFRRI